jgi:hypothetical protein
VARGIRPEELRGRRAVVIAVVEKEDDEEAEEEDKVESRGAKVDGEAKAEAEEADGETEVEDEEVLGEKSEDMATGTFFEEAEGAEGDRVVVSRALRSEETTAIERTVIPRLEVLG